MPKNKYIIILTVIVALGFILRIIGFNFAYVFQPVSDETYQNSCALRMIQNKTLSLNNCGSPYPALYTLINLPNIVIGLFILLLKSNFDLEIFKQFLALYPFSSTLPIIRLFSVIMGTATIVLIYKITRLLFNSQTKGLIAAAFLAVSFVPVQYSHRGGPWIIMVFFTSLALYYAVLIYRESKSRHYILNAVFTSSALGIHYVGFFSVIFVFLGHFFRKPFGNHKNFYLGLSLTLFLSGLWLFLNRQGVYHMLLDPREGFQAYYQGGGISRYFASAFLYLKYFIVFNPVVAPLFAAALLFNFRKLLEFRYLLPTAFFIFYLVGMVLLDYNIQVHWLLPLIIVSFPIVADFLGDVRIKLKSNIVYTILIISLLFPSLLFSASFDYIFTLPTTYFAAKNWIEENVPVDSKVLFLDITSVLAVSQEGARSLNEALAGIRPPNPRYLYLAENGQKVWPGYRVVNLTQFLDNPNYPAWQKFDYYILSYLDEAQYRQQISLIPKLDGLELMQQIKPFDGSDKWKSFRAGGRNPPLEHFKIMFKNIKMTGPSIEIYKAI